MKIIFEINSEEERWLVYSTKYILEENNIYFQEKINFNNAIYFVFSSATIIENAVEKYNIKSLKLQTVNRAKCNASIW